MELVTSQTGKVELLANPKYYLALTALFRDEARFLKEWIEFYKLMGVEHFYLFNHLSADNYQEVLDPYIKEELVEVTNINYEPKNSDDWYYSIHFPTYNNISKTVANEVEWLIVVDTDEFMYPLQAENISSVLHNYEEYASLCVNWRKFGSNSIQRIQSNELMIEQLYLRDNVPEIYLKNIIKPRYVESFTNPHFAHLKAGYNQVTENYEGLNAAYSFIPSNHVLTINHYQFRDLEFFNTRKLSRLHILEKNISSQERSVKINKLVEENSRYSSVYDDKILRFAPELRKRLFGSEGTKYVSSKLIDIANDKKLAQLPSNLTYIIKAQNDIPYSLKQGYGYEPYMIRKILTFIKERETYVEIGAGYGEFALQVAKKLEPMGKVYAYEIDVDLYQYLSMNAFINDAAVIEVNNLMPRSIKADVIRINFSGNKCKIIESIKSISDNTRIFINVQSDMSSCFKDLDKKGFIFIDLDKFNEECSYLVHQQDYRLSYESVEINTEILIIKKETFEYFRQISSNTEACKELANKIMFHSATVGRKDYLELALARGADINYYDEGLSGTALYYAINQKNTEVAQYLIRNGADIELGYHKVVTPLYHAAEKGLYGVVKLLVEYGANKNFTFFERTPAEIARYYGHEDIFSLLTGRDNNDLDEF